MTDHYREAERPSKPQPTGFRRLSQDPEAYTGPMLPAQLAVAQLHPTLAVTGQLARIADAPERLVGPREGREHR